MTDKKFKNQVFFISTSGMGEKAINIMPYVHSRKATLQTKPLKIMELGTGFSFVGNQYHMEICGMSTTTHRLESCFAKREIN